MPGGEQFATSNIESDVFGLWRRKARQGTRAGSTTLTPLGAVQAVPGVVTSRSGFRRHLGVAAAETYNALG